MPAAKLKTKLTAEAEWAVGKIEVEGEIKCPFCDSSSTYLDSAFGPTRCRAIHYCSACGNSFERLKRV